MCSLPAFQYITCPRYAFEVDTLVLPVLTMFSWVILRMRIELPESLHSYYFYASQLQGEQEVSSRALIDGLIPCVALSAETLNEDCASFRLKVLQLKRRQGTQSENRCHNVRSLLHLDTTFRRLYFLMFLKQGTWNTNLELELQRVRSNAPPTSGNLRVRRKRICL